MDAERKNLEEQVIRHYMSNPNSFAWGNLGTTKPYLRIAARTNSGKVYVLRIELQNYPSSKPNAYVECMLTDCHGRPMNSASSANHTLSTGLRSAIIILMHGGQICLSGWFMFVVSCGSTFTSRHSERARIWSTILNTCQAITKLNC